jgi:Ca2+-binding RTX toxin-like protein
LQCTNKNGVIQGLGGKSVLIEPAGNDLICGSMGNDTLNGGAGNDQLFSDLGNDQLDGGPQQYTCNDGDQVDLLSPCEQATGVPS